MTSEKRPYRMTKRAEAQDRTRLRITESAVALHGTLGPARTSLSAVAEHAGVRRSTLYRHFPDEEALIQACSAHWRAANEPPDFEAWAAIADPAERLTVALTELYAYYARTEQMLSNLTRDAEVDPFVRKSFSRFGDYLTAARDVLLAGRALRGKPKRRTAAALGHALSFTTWRSLVREQGLAEAQAVALMSSLVTPHRPEPAAEDAQTSVSAATDYSTRAKTPNPPSPPRSAPGRARCPS
jgi:AcrR family transcriptional regulator